MNSIFCGVKDEEISINSLPLLYSFLVFVLIVKTVPVDTEYICSKTGSPSSSRIRFPNESCLFLQFFKSNPIPPVTSTVVKNIGDTPFVPAITGAIFIKGIYLLDFSPIQRATLLTPDILDEPTPIVPFSAINITLLSGCFACRANNSFCCSLLCSNIHCPCSCLSDLE